MCNSMSTSRWRCCLGILSKESRSHVSIRQLDEWHRWWGEIFPVFLAPVKRLVLIESAGFVLQVCCVNSVHLHWENKVDWSVVEREVDGTMLIQYNYIQRTTLISLVKRKLHSCTCYLCNIPRAISCRSGRFYLSTQGQNYKDNSNTNSSYILWNGSQESSLNSKPIKFS